MRLVQEVFSVTQRRLGVLINSHDAGSSKAGRAHMSGEPKLAIY